jgi:hypothetical protein
MSAGEEAYLALVIVAWLVFGGALFWSSLQSP